MKIDIELVYEIVQDFTKREILLKNKQRETIWINSYNSEESLNRAFSEINRIFAEEVKRRSKNNEMEEVAWVYLNGVV